MRTEKWGLGLDMERLFNILNEIHPPEWLTFMACGRDYDRKNNLYKIVVNTIHYAYEGKCNETKNAE